MKSTAFSMFLIGSMVLGGVVAAVAEEAPTQAATESTGADTVSVETAVPQSVCPVMGGPISKDVYADYEGKRIYFCCAGCEGPFSDDPAAYVEKLESQGVTLEKIPQPQTHCPITGKKIDKVFYVDHEGSRIYACSASCIEKIASEPDTYIERFEKQGVTIEDAAEAEERESSSEEPEE